MRCQYEDFVVAMLAIDEIHRGNLIGIYPEVYEGTNHIKCSWPRSRSQERHGYIE